MSVETKNYHFDVFLCCVIYIFHSLVSICLIKSFPIMGGKLLPIFSKHPEYLFVDLLSSKRATINK
jgi:hypothetical protein